MKFREICKQEVSALGFGCMRLPIIDNDNSKIDEAKAIEMLRYAIDNGVNYIDTAYPYHMKNSESFVGRALKDGYREKVFLATKMPVWMVEKNSDLDKYFEEQLEKLQTDYIDFYLLHGLKKEVWESMKKVGVLKWAEKKKEEGKIKFFGFSFHDNFSVFEKIINEYDKWDFCMIQYNYVNEEHQAGTKGLKLANSKGISVISMEPLHGGSLANIPNNIKEIFESSSKKRTPVEWALNWLWNKPEISLLLSGMSSMDQVKQNIEYANNSEIGSFSEEDNQIIKKVQDAFKSINPIPCTKCNYCMPCPHGIDIPYNFSIYNDGFVYDSMSLSKILYKGSPVNTRASSCIRCNICEQKCPQKIKISEWMQKVDKELGE